MVAALRREPRRSAEDLCPVRRQPLDVLRVLAGVGERVVQLGIGEAPGVVGGGESEEGGLAPGEREERRAHGATVPRRGRTRQ